MATSKIEKLQFENEVANVSSSVTYNSKLTTGGQRAKVYIYGTTRKLAVCTFNLGLTSGKTLSAGEAILSRLPIPNDVQSFFGAFGTTVVRLNIDQNGSLSLDGMSYKGPSNTQYLNVSITYVVAA